MAETTYKKGELLFEGNITTNGSTTYYNYAMGMSSTQLILVVGAVTCVVAMFIFRKKTK